MKFKSFFLLFSILLAILFSSGFAFSMELERNVQSHLHQIRDVSQQAAIKLKRSASVTPELERLKQLTESLQIDHLLLQGRFADRSGQAAGLSGQIQQRQQTMEQVYGQVISDLLSALDLLQAALNPTEAEFQVVIALIDKSLPEPKHPILGSLPYRNPNFSARQPVVLPAVTPAYQTGSSTVTEADTQGTANARITPEIAALAESLNWNPLNIYAWVSSNIETEWYWGSMKGAAETLRQKSGNDADQAALLIALMRAANFPARYVRGVIEFDPGIDRLQDLLGLDDPLKSVRFLQQAGIPAEPVIAGGRISNVRIEHVWVEAYVPYANYRGAVLDEQGKIWLPLDTHLKPEGYLFSQPTTEIPLELVDAVRDAYLQVSRTETPLEFLRQQVETATSSPWDGTLVTRQLQQSTVEVLPASLQFNTVVVTGESASLPADLIQTLTFRGGAEDGSELFSLTVPVREVSNRQVVLSYEPESLDDQQLIDAHGGLSNTPAYLVRLRPVLLIDGERKIVAKDGLAMGDDYQLTSVFQGPSGSAAQTARHIVGNPAALGIVAQRALPTPVLPEEEQDAVWMLWETAQDYIARWNRAEEEFAAFFNLRMSRPFPTLVTVGGVLDVSRLLDMPQEMTWKGLFIDAGLRRIELAAQSGEQQRVVAFMRLSALQGSVLEQRIFEDRFQVASVCTARVLASANESGNPVLTLDSSNAADLLPTLVLPEHIRSDIEAAVHQGLRVTLPADETTLLQWSGFGYLKENPLTGEAGYMLSGRIAGGMTIEEWAEDYRKNTLQAPFADPPNSDPLAAVHIAKILINDRQSGIVGQQLEKPLAVLVTDIKGRPVVGAKVVFTHTAGLVKQADNAPAVTYVETSDAQGIARFQPVLGTKTGANPSFQRVNLSDTNVTQVGVNLFDASVESYYGDLSVNQPFEVYGRPDVAASLKKFLGDGNSSNVNSPAGSLLLKVFDQYENPVSNVPVTFAAQDAKPASASVLLDPDFRNIEFYRSNECTIAYPLWNDCQAVSSSTLTLDSSYHGAMVDTLLGNTLATDYTVEASAPGVESVIFKLSTGGWNSPGKYYPPSLYVNHMSTVNESGQRIDAVKVGDAFNKPLRAALVLTYSDYYLSEKKTCTSGTGSNMTTYDCWDLHASDLIQTRKITDGKVTFDPKTGGQVTATTIDTDGLYQINYTAGDVPALNLVDILGEAQVEVPVVYGTVSNDTYFTVKGTRLTSATIAERTVTLKSGQIGLFDSESKNLIPVENQQKETFSIYGVDVPTQINPQIIMLGDGGMARQDVTTDYTILPQGAGTAGYTAYNTYLDLFSGNCEAGVSDKWIGYLFGSAKQGAGDAVYSRGAVFDPRQQYCVQMVLNRGSSSEIRGDKVKLNTLYADLDIDSDNNAGWLADGTHNLPSRNPLEDQIEDLAGQPGKVIKPNLLDVDGDNVPGFADGIDLNGQEGDGASAPFVPMMLEIDTRLDTSKIKLKFNYSASDPAQVKQNGNEVDGYTYQAAPGHLRIWTKDGGESRKVASVKNGGNYVSPEKTYALSDFGLMNGGVINLYVEGMSTGSTVGDQQIRLIIDPSGTETTTLIGDVVSSTVVLAALVPDYNHDGRIDGQDAVRAERGDTYYFWINDDNDSGETEGDDIPDYPGSMQSHNGGTNSVNDEVNGMRDLIDFFPIKFNLKNILNTFPKDRFQYVLARKDTGYFVLSGYSELEQFLSDGALNFFTTDMASNRIETDQTSWPYHSSVALAKELANRKVDKINNQGVTLDAAFIDLAGSVENKGIALFEGIVPSAHPLRLEIRDKEGNVAFNTSLNLSLDGVEQMFRHKNLIQELSTHEEYRLKDHEPVPSDVGMPDRGVNGDAGFSNKIHFAGFDAESDQGNFVHVHGYNVNGQAARGEQSEAFKRLYWSGSRAKFWGITWYGWESQLFFAERSPNYHVNVRHAFNTSRLLKEFVSNEVQGEVSIFAHSLGNMVVSSAISGGLNVDKYLMVNPAVAEEAFTPESFYASGDSYDINSLWIKKIKESMIHPAWRYPDGLDIPLEQGYQPFLWSSEWYKLFKDVAGDERATLTWRNAFENVRKQERTYVYYSPTDEAFRPFNYTVQMAADDPEGTNYLPNVDDWPGLEDVFLNYRPGNRSHIGSYAFALQELFKGRFSTTADSDSDTGGWGFNLDRQDGYLYEHFVRPNIANNYPPERLKSKPFFSKNTDYTDLYNKPIFTVSDNDRAEFNAMREELLANEIPALTFAAGHRGVEEFKEIALDRDTDIRANYAVGNPWPRDTDEYDWRHSDVYVVAYPYLSKLYDEWVKKIQGDTP